MCVTRTNFAIYFFTSIGEYLNGEKCTLVMNKLTFFTNDNSVSKVMTKSALLSFKQKTTQIVTYEHTFR